ncbi:FKBP-type peptidyl-prolyl cis-trans isomerase [Microbacterium sp. NC79]|uniref:FKBP-type peptidyl-prolyl cis-trans isomerase n=1 Tax=Microbacterium sp. NC79 TaxID=2851009 RepID=UPI001C2C9DC3|nr:FKBP-type peptidyl-prolyl cis-trans isomerase [Microbacterium sp. NC79]
MRARLSLIAPTLLISALALAGCSSSGGNPTPTPTETSAGGESTAVDPATDLCGAAYESGPAIEAVTVDTDISKEPTVTFTAPLEVADIERVVTVEGDGEQIKYGQLVDVAQTIFDASTGEKIAEAGWTSDPILQSIVAETGMAQAISCATVGSRIAVTTPASTDRPAYIWIFDIQGITPTTAWGEAQPAVEGMPIVTLAEDGTPTVTVPEGDAPTEVKLATLKEGDGDVVAPGDTVTVQYMGVKWSDGTEFDSSWSRGAVPTSFPTTGVVEGFKQALEGYKVGSQVLVVVPPAAGYGANPDHELAKETLIFVVDILATATPSAQ